MSRVFLAEETRLSRQVVVKVLPPEMGAAVNIERFEREIQLAARLQHPHIVSLLTAASSGDLLYYIMPYIAGESLRAKLGREGALPVAEAVKILREITDALAYAHAHSVVHRDIKPDNVLLSTGHAVVTDFGVAKAVTASSGGEHASLTSLGVALGTPAYMAPEQAAADPHVDHRADIYAVGVMAYEMLVGRTPFVSPTPQGMLAAHITQAPDPLTKHRPSVPNAVNTLVMRCLEKHPADRWQTAGDLLAQLELVLTPSGGSAPTDAVPAVSSGTKEALKKSHPVRVIAAFTGASIATLAVVWVAVQQLGLPDWVFYGAIILLILGLPIILATGYFERKRAQARATGRIIPPNVSGVHRLFTWQKAIRGGFIAFTTLGIVTAIYTGMRLLGIGPAGTLMASGKLAGNSQIIVADFVNRTSDTTLGQTLTEAFRIDLAQSNAIRIMTSSAMSEALRRMQKEPGEVVTAEVAREMATREGAKAVVVGEVSTAGRNYLLVARVLDADGQELVALRETSADDAGIVAAVDRLSGKVRERIGESLRTIRDGTPLLRVTTGSLEALRLYSEAMRLTNAGEDPQAIPLLRQAVAIDSTFAMGWRKLAVAIANTGGSWADVTDATTRAYQLREQLPEMERQATLAFYFDNVDRQGDKVEAAYQRMLDIDSANQIAGVNLTAFQLGRGKCTEAQRTSERAMAVGVPVMLGNVMSYMCAGDTAKARRTLTEYAGDGDSASFRFLRARAMVLSMIAPDDSASAAWDAALRVANDPDRERQLLNFKAALESTRGRLAAAERETARHQAIATRTGRRDAWLTLEVERLRRAFASEGDSAATTTGLAAALAKVPPSSLDPYDRPMPMIASLHAMLGHPREARRALDEYVATTSPGFARSDPEWFRAKVQVALAEHRPDDALAEAAVMEQNGGYFAAQYLRAIAYEQKGLPDSAVAYYDLAAEPRGEMYKAFDDAFSRAASLERLGELYEARGDKAKALEQYGRFVELWKDADPVLQPRVKDVKSRMAKLAGEPK